MRYQFALMPLCVYVCFYVAVNAMSAILVFGRRGCMYEMMLWQAALLTLNVYDCLFPNLCSANIFHSCGNINRKYLLVE